MPAISTRQRIPMTLQECTPIHLLTTLWRRIDSVVQIGFRILFLISRGWSVLPPCAHLRTETCSVEPRFFEPSYFSAMSFWYQRSKVSGWAMVAYLHSMFRPKDFAFTASRRRSASVKLKRVGPSFFRRTRFSSIKYSISVCCLR